MKRVFGLIGHPLSHSFSKRYFAEKFEQEQIKNAGYELFPLASLKELPNLILGQKNLCGLNITIPYKQAIFDHLDTVDEEAAAIGAVNTIKIIDGKLHGYNTDVYGFEQSLRRFLGTVNPTLQALVLGSGGAAKAVIFVLRKLGIPYKVVSRQAATGDLVYEEVTTAILQAHQLIINTTPLGMSPDTETAPNLPYIGLSSQHFVYDLVYNPAETVFLQLAAIQGAKWINGLEMLQLQAEGAWEIWNKEE